MKIIYLLRHAEAEKQPNLDDKERPLTKNGFCEVIDLSKVVEEKNINFDLVLCSPAKRTRQTCELFLKNTNINLDIKTSSPLYNPTLNDFLQIITSIDKDVNSVLIVSHNPTISEITNFLSNSTLHFISFNTANLAKIELDLDNWQDTQEDCGKISWFL